MHLSPSQRQLLCAAPLLAGIDPALQEALVARFAARWFEPDAALIRRGDADRHLLVLLEGSAEVVLYEDGQPVVVARLGPGELAGEMSFFDAFPVRSADVQATTRVCAAVLSLTDWRALSADQPQAIAAVERAMLQQLAGRLGQTNAQLSALLPARTGGVLEGLWRALARLGVGWTDGR